MSDQIANCKLQIGDLKVVKALPVVSLPSESGRVNERPMLSWVDLDICCIRYAKWLRWVKPGFFQRGGRDGK